MASPRIIAFAFLLHAPAHAQDADCPSPYRDTQLAEDYIANYFFARADASLQAATAALACDPTATPKSIAKVWRVHGTRFAMDGQEQRAAAFFAAARALDPSSPPTNAEYRDAWEAADVGKTPYKVVGIPRGWELRVDGEVVPSTGATDQGPHMVEVGAPGSPPVWREYRFAPFEGTLTIRMPPFEGAPPVEESADDEGALVAELGALVDSERWSDAEALVMDSTGDVPDSGRREWYLQAAIISEQLGESADRYDRLAAALELSSPEQRPDIEDELTLMEANFGRVALRGSTLQVVLAASDSAATTSIRTATLQLAKRGEFSGLLPSGTYLFQGKELLVRPLTSVSKSQAPLPTSYLHFSADLGGSVGQMRSSVGRATQMAPTVGMLLEGYYRGSNSLHLDGAAQLMLAPIVLQSSSSMLSDERKNQGFLGGSVGLGSSRFRIGPWGGLSHTGAWDPNTDGWFGALGVAAHLDENRFSGQVRVSFTPNSVQSRFRVAIHPVDGPWVFGAQARIRAMRFDARASQSQPDSLLVGQLGVTVGYRTSAQGWSQ